MPCWLGAASTSGTAGGVCEVNTYARVQDQIFRSSVNTSNHIGSTWNLKAPASNLWPQWKLTVQVYSSALGLQASFDCDNTWTLTSWVFSLFGRLCAAVGSLSNLCQWLYYLYCQAHRSLTNYWVHGPNNAFTFVAANRTTFAIAQSFTLNIS